MVVGLGCFYVGDDCDLPIKYLIKSKRYVEVGYLVHAVVRNLAAWLETRKL